MPAGEIALRDAPVPAGYARVETGALVKIHPTCGPVGSEDPFTTRDSRRVDEIIAQAEEATGLRFAAYIGDLGADTRAGAVAIVDSLGDDAAYAALVAISPAQRVAEIVTGTEAALRISERGARAAVLSVINSCANGNLLEAVTNGIRILTDHAGEVSDN